MERDVNKQSDNGGRPDDKEMQNLEQSGTVQLTTDTACIVAGKQV